MKSLLRLLTVAVVSLSSCCLSARAAKVATSAASNQTEANAISSAGDGTLPAPSEFTIPGPLRSFLRMAGISQKTTPEEVLPLLSRNVFMQGYEGSGKLNFSSS